MRNLLGALQVLMAFILTIPANASVAVNRFWGNDKTVISATLYIAVWLDGLTSTNGNFLTSNTKILPGISSFDQQQLPKGIDFVCTEIRALAQTTGTNEASGTPGLALCTWVDPAPVNFKNCDFTITQGALLFASSGTDVTNFKASTGNDDDFRTIVPFRIRGGINFQINAALPNAGAANQGIKLEMRGYYLANTDQSTGNA